MKTYQLPKEFAKNGLAALKSGKYEQAINRYKKGENCFCAMGVFYVANGLLNESDMPIVDYFHKSRTEHGSLWDLISTWNDCDKKPFAEIARLIEQNVEFI